jgi:beta-lactamase superfamily II metal-dependent hydrolase
MVVDPPVVAIPGRSPDGWKPGEFQILFLSMGQGDCCVITCPDGRHVMIDCGSKAEESDSSWHNIVQLLRSPDVVGQSSSKATRTGDSREESAYKLKHDLVALILTHPDKDHISKVGELLGGRSAGYKYTLLAAPGEDAPKSPPVKKRGRAESDPETESFDPITVQTVYFSEPDRNRDDFRGSPLRQYKLSKCSSTIYNVLGVRQLCCVTLNATEAHVDRWKLPDKVSSSGEGESVDEERTPFNATHHVNEPADRNGVIVHESPATSEIPWSVKIIAGNVAKRQFEAEKEEEKARKEADEGELEEAPADRDQSDPDGRNAGSLVTLIEYDQERILICGDATISTEAYLLSDVCPCRPKLASLALIQVPHHGSDLTSFSTSFVNHCKAKRAVMSVQVREHAHHLPGRNTINKAMHYAIAPTDAPFYMLCVWELVTPEQLDLFKKEWEEQKDAYPFTIQKSQGRDARYVRTNLPADYEGLIMLDGLAKASPKRHVLRQFKCLKDVRQTSMQQHTWYYFDGKNT